MTAGCGPTAIGADYSYPGGGTSMNGTAKDNLIPQLSLLAEREPNFWGWAFDLLPANKAGSTAGAQAGTFWRNTGILFDIYTYEDIANSKLTLYMRKRFWMPYMSYMIARCDGKGPTYSFTEGGNWISNKIRALFHMNQAQTYLLYADDELIGNVQEITNGYPSLTVNEEKSGKERASVILKERDFHGGSDLWLVTNRYHDSLPYFITATIALPMAYETAQNKKASASEAAPAATSGDSSTPSFLATMPEKTKTDSQMPHDLEEEGAADEASTDRPRDVGVKATHDGGSPKEA